MTTLELIEHGIEYNCLADAYDLGRADEQRQSIEDAKKQAIEYLDALDKAKKEAYQQGVREFAEWFAECGKVSEPIKEYTINRWLEDFSKWQKGAENV